MKWFQNAAKGLGDSETVFSFKADPYVKTDPVKSLKRFPWKLLFSVTMSL